jgi:polysaccharide export outer membrane protein
MPWLYGRAGFGALGALALFSGLAASPLPLGAAPLPGPKARITVPMGSAKAKPGFAMQDDAYILGAGDSLDLKLFDAPELSGGLDVLNDGTVSLPLIGSVRVQGLTLSQAQQWFTTLFRKQLQRPDLQLKVVRPRPIRVALVG